MRTIDYVRLPATGPGEIPTRGTAADLLRDIPYLLVHGLLPPLAIVNEILRSGCEDAGMSGGCRWSPFELSAAEFDEVRQDLFTKGGGLGRPLRKETPPQWVTSREEFAAWAAERRSGIPALESLKLQAAIRECDTAARAAEQAGDAATWRRKMIETMELSMRWSEFVAAHRRPPRD